MKVNIIKENIHGENENPQDNYLFFSSLELIDYFFNNIAEKDIKTQTKRILEMAKVFMRKKDFELEDIYSILVMVRDINYRSIVNEVFRFYFKEERFPTRVFVQISEIESTADIEMEFSAFRGEKVFINLEKGYPHGPFSQGVIIEDYVHCSGVLPFNATEDGNFKQDIRLCLGTLQKVLESAGTGLDKAYSFIVYLSNLELLTEMEEVFAEYFPEEDDTLQKVIKVEKLIDNHKIEISCSAHLK
jgi:2-iminobutanoate/2-iminopropanoate deaminase